MKSYRRTDRLNRLFREELSRLIRTELDDPRVRMATITDVVTTTDLAHATVYVRTLDDEEGAAEAIRGLESASGLLRRELGRGLRIRRVPELHFEPDQTLERASRIDTLLRRVHEEGGERDDA